MSLEAEFRRRFASVIKPHFMCEYMSSMSKSGVPDIHMIVGSLGVWLELKAVDRLPKRDTSDVLGKHGFTGPQVTFMKRALRNGGVGAGLIGIKDSGKWSAIFVLPHVIMDNGGLTKEEFFRHRRIIVDSLFHNKLATMIKRASPGC